MAALTPTAGATAPADRATESPRPAPRANVAISAGTLEADPKIIPGVDGKRDRAYVRVKEYIPGREATATQQAINEKTSYRGISVVGNAVDVVRDLKEGDAATFIGKLETYADKQTQTPNYQLKAFEVTPGIDRELTYKPSQVQLAGKVVSEPRFQPNSSNPKLNQLSYDIETFGKSPERLRIVERGDQLGGEPYTENRKLVFPADPAQLEARKIGSELEIDGKLTEQSIAKGNGVKTKAFSISTKPEQVREITREQAREATENDRANDLADEAAGAAGTIAAAPSPAAGRATTELETSPESGNREQTPAIGGPAINGGVPPAPPAQEVSAAEQRRSLIEQRAAVERDLEVILDENSAKVLRSDPELASTVSSLKADLAKIDEGIAALGEPSAIAETRDAAVLPVFTPPEASTVENREDFNPALEQQTRILGRDESGARVIGQLGNGFLSVPADIFKEAPLVGELVSIKGTIDGGDVASSVSREHQLEV